MVGEGAILLILSASIFIKIGTSKVAVYVKGNILDQLH
jgi:hypothetical protein